MQKISPKSVRATLSLAVLSLAVSGARADGFNASRLVDAVRGGVLVADFNVASDLNVETLEVQEQPGNRFALRAVLRNGAAGSPNQYNTYPGGGFFVLRRSSGGTFLNPPGVTPISRPDFGQELARVPIPALANKQAIEIHATTTGRAIFDAFVLLASDADRRNNVKVVDNLISRAIPLNTFTVNAAIGNLLGGAQLRLDRDDSFVRVPGLVDLHGKIPEVSKSLGVGSARFYPRDINMSRLLLSVGESALIANLDFETGGDEIVGYLHTVFGNSDSAMPNVNASPLKAKVKLPLAYDPTNQRVVYGAAKVDVTANWSFTGPASLLNWLLPDINGRFEEKGGELFNNAAVKSRIEYALNAKIHALTAGGHLNGIDFSDPDQPVLHVELPQ